MPLKSRNSNGLLEKLTPHAPVVTQNVRQDVLQGGRQMGDDGRYLTKRDGVWHYQRRAERLRRIRQARHRQAVNQDQGRQRSYRQQGDPRRRPDERNARGLLAWSRREQGGRGAASLRGRSEARTLARARLPAAADHRTAAPATFRSLVWRSRRCVGTRTASRATSIRATIFRQRR